jgi:hypothetical protein
MGFNRKLRRAKAGITLQPVKRSEPIEQLAQTYTNQLLDELTAEAVELSRSVEGVEDMAELERRSRGLHKQFMAYQRKFKIAREINRRLNELIDLLNTGEEMAGLRAFRDRLDDLK